MVLDFFLGSRIPKLDHGPNQMERPPPPTTNDVLGLGLASGLLTGPGRQMHALLQISTRQSLFASAMYAGLRFFGDSPLVEEKLGVEIGRIIRRAHGGNSVYGGIQVF